MTVVAFVLAVALVEVGGIAALVALVALLV
jgi:hypothetical protein